MIKVLDLFAGTQSVKKALDEMGIEYEYKGLDIYSPEDENIIFDLSQENIIEELLKTLGDWTPDFIWCSPTCNKVSNAITGPRGNGYFLKATDMNGKTVIRPRIDFSNVKHNRMHLHKERWVEFNQDAILALKLHNNTRKIVNYFDVPFVIENPFTSLAMHIYSDFYKNKAEYCAYGFEYKKATAFYTNKELQLKTHNKEDGHRCLAFSTINKTDRWPSHWNKDVSTYANRSSVPPMLIKEIIKQLLEVE